MRASYGDAHQGRGNRDLPFQMMISDVLSQKLVHTADRPNASSPKLTAALAFGYLQA
jgi:hypothetical protein